MREGNEVKITTAHGVVDVMINPGRKSDGRPNAGMEYTASLRCSSEGVVRLTLATDFTPPCLLAVLPEFDVAQAGPVLAELGLYMPAIDRWTKARPGVYAFVDGVRYVEPAPEELEFMAAFGFTPGARFDLALPMLRAQRAQLTNVSVLLSAGMVMNADGELAVPDSAMEVEVAQLAAEYLEVGGAGVPMEPVEELADYPKLPAPAHPAGVSGATTLVVDTPPEPKRRRRAAKPAGKVETVSQTLGESTEETLVPDAAIADVFDVLDAAPAPKEIVLNAPPLTETNPFMIEGL
jgi:hypothetical protein